MDLSKELIKINQSLCARKIRLRIEQRGEKLNLRGVLPCKINGSHTKRNQRISLCLPANKYGLKEAEKTLQLVLLQLERNQFDWSCWLNTKVTTPKSDISHKSNWKISDAIENFKDAFFSDPIRQRYQAGSRTTWHSAYLPYLRRLLEISQAKEEKLETILFHKTLLSYEINSRSRQQCATALNAFANHYHIKLPESWRAESGGYGLHQARFRKLPDDNLILDSWNKIPNSSWKLIYGLMATYGLRNHEAFFCDYSSLTQHGDGVIRVLPNTKTGEHQAWPFHPEWLEFFELNQLASDRSILPKINVDLRHTTLQQIGRRVSEQFRRYELPLTPYDLRHAWAVRTIHIGLPDTVAARMMGHSVAIHTRTYHHWITRRDQQQAVDNALAKR